MIISTPFTLGGYCYLVDCTMSVTTNTATLAMNIEMEFIEIAKERKELVENYEEYWEALKKSNELEEKIIKSKSLIYLTLKELKTIKEQILIERLSKDEI
ncbi:MAG: Unknown protein [uncultured Sulfurovum sp.]|uniref:Uncharacterized protein n=1 Tax=uncultured Sulfurovum sp. TaxID=269237 RepID=A0A6S6TRZ9_9BACT|nr:MAG: Unknown protein [uncultured Sulfurovum sp.]